MTHDRSAYVHFQVDSVFAIVSTPSGGGASTELYRPPRWFEPNWMRMGPDGQTLYVFSPDSVGDPAYWAVDLRTKALRKVVTFDHSETRAVRGVFDTDGSGSISWPANTRRISGWRRSRKGEQARSVLHALALSAPSVDRPRAD